MKGSIVILSFFALGLLTSAFHWLPQSISEMNWSFYALCLLMFAVGISIGNNPNTVKQFKRLHSRILFLPLMTIAGTYAGVLATGIFLKERSLTELLAVGSGFGYYSLSSILITQYKGVELGTIALLSNIIREIITLLLAPLMVRHFGKLAPISSGGATTMDTTFPIIIRNSGEEYAIVSIYHGFIMDFSVPFLVTLWCSW